MLCCQSAKERERRENKRAIERHLRKSKRQARKELKLLVLGTGESGKSTFIKQMKIINGKGYTDKEKKEYVSLIYQNIFMSLNTMIRAMERLQIPYQHARSQMFAEVVTNMNSNKIVALSDRDVETIRSLWMDAGIQECYKRRFEFHLTDSTKYYMDDLDRIAAADFVPTEQDILRSRVPTTGIVDYTFDIHNTIFRLVDGSLEGARMWCAHECRRMFDVGGQRNERKKWIHCFQNVTAVLFLVAISEYDQKLMEAECDNRLAESLALFRVIIGYPWFENSALILFLNKTDIFEEKIRTSHLADHFPEYTGPQRNAEIARQFILNKFINLHSMQHDKSVLYTHFTCATDTENIRVVFSSVKDSIIFRNLQEFNLI